MTSPSEIRTALPRGGRLPRVGKLRAGQKKTSTKAGKAVEYPSATDYWVVNADASTSEQSAASFHRVYGEQPRVLRVVLPAENPEDVLQGAWRLYGTGGLLKRKCQGPGGQCEQSTPTGRVVGPCVCDTLPVDSKERCELRWTLSVLLMDVEGIGVWQFDTGSSMAAEGMTATLDLLKNLYGSLLNVECLLSLVPRQVSPQGKAKTVWIAQLDAQGLTPADALAITKVKGPLLTAPELPSSSLDERPDELLDHERMQVIEAPVPPPPPPPAPRPAPPSPADQSGPRPVALQLRDMTLEDRADLYDLAGIPRGTKAPEVRALVCGAWDVAGMPDFGEGEPDLQKLLARLRTIKLSGQKTGVEAFQVFADTGQEIEPGDQVSMYGEGAPS